MLFRSAGALQISNQASKTEFIENPAFVGEKMVADLVTARSLDDAIQYLWNVWKLVISYEDNKITLVSVIDTPESGTKIKVKSVDESRDYGILDNKHKSIVDEIHIQADYLNGSVSYGVLSDPKQTIPALYGTKGEAELEILLQQRNIESSNHLLDIKTKTPDDWSGIEALLPGKVLDISEDDDSTDFVYVLELVINSEAGESTLRCIRPIGLY